MSRHRIPESPARARTIASRRRLGKGIEEDLPRAGLPAPYCTKLRLAGPAY